MKKIQVKIIRKSNGVFKITSSYLLHQTFRSATVRNIKSKIGNHWFIYMYIQTRELTVSLALHTPGGPAIATITRIIFALANNVAFNNNNNKRTTAVHNTHTHCSNILTDSLTGFPNLFFPISYVIIIIIINARGVCRGIHKIRALQLLYTLHAAVCDDEPSRENGK